MVTLALSGDVMPPMKLVQACGHVGGGDPMLYGRRPPPMPPNAPPTSPLAGSLDTPPGPNMMAQTQGVELSIESAFTVAVDISDNLWAFGDNYYGRTCM